MKFLKTSLFIITTFLLFLSSAKAEELVYNPTGYYYDRYNQDYSYHHSFRLENYYIDGNIAFCIEPDVDQGNPIHEATYEDTYLPISIKNKLLLIAYYGYTYPNHQTIEYKAATQGLLWKTILGDDINVNFYTERWGAGDKLNIDNEVDNINNLITHHYDVPSFANQNYDVQYGSDITLVDNYNILQNFNVKTTNATHQIIGNKLILTPHRVGEITVTLTKKDIYSNNYKIFVGDGKQNLLIPGNFDKITKSFKLNSYLSNITINKVDRETNQSIAQGEATLANAKYGIYDSKTDTLVTELITDEYGVAKKEKILRSGNYYIKEITPSKGYLLDDSIYQIDATNKKDITIDVYESVIKNKINILKVFDDVNTESMILNPEENISFDIFNSKNEKYAQITTDDNGIANIFLPYGSWLFKQINSTNGFTKINDFSVVVNEYSKLEQYYNILNNIFSAYLKVEKIDSETNKTILMDDTTFKILDLNTNKYVSQFIGGKYIDEFKTNSDGIMYTPLMLKSGKYMLIEITAPYGYVKNDDLLFEINEENSNVENNFRVVSVKYYNDPVKGIITINKLGEVFNIDNNTFNYDKYKILISTFNIYAYDDILSIDKTYLYYKKNQLVDTITTNLDGVAKSIKLPLGKYRLVEVSTMDNYVIDNNDYIVELTYLNDLDKIVYKDLTIINKLKKGTLEFCKEDLINSSGIPNTKISIYTINDELIYTGYTDSEGKIIINNLAVGKYYILETEAPNGYKLNPEKLYFEITNDGDVVKSVMKDEIIEVPDTDITFNTCIYWYKKDEI